MERSLRKPLQGVTNIVRFNWHYYVLAASLVAIILFARYYLNFYQVAASLLGSLIIGSILVSLCISGYIYDFSDLYKFKWLNELKTGENYRILNLNAGFDETTELLKRKFHSSEIMVADFYDPSRHTEISIQRARKAYPAVRETIQVKTTHLPFNDNSIDKIFSIFSAHEIRNDLERKHFFIELERVLNPIGEIIITEHLRDPMNFLAYNIGFFHFHSKGTWLQTFQSAGLLVSKEIKITPFITTFILKKNGIPS